MANRISNAEETNGGPAKGLDNSVPFYSFTPPLRLHMFLASFLFYMGR
jgi:hypothetical protein